MRALGTLREKLSSLGADALLVTHPANVRYLSGFSSPEDARVLVTQEAATLLTDGRYIAQAGEESRLSVEVLEGTWTEKLGERLNGHRVAVEAEHLTLATFEELKEKLGREPTPTKGLVSELRLVKSPQEIETLRQAAHLTDRAFEHILGFLRAGRTEVEVALELERFLRVEGAEGTSFETIVASGVRSAMPHGVASSKVIARGELVTLDFGAKLDGYHADMTRTLAVGEVRDEQRRMYEAVLEAQLAALEALAPGRDGQDVDAQAREVLRREGLEEHFTHGLGHGVGLEVHEGPRLRKGVSQTLEPGMAVTVEPGVYIPGEAGMRIEDLTVITETGYERLSGSPKACLQL